MEDRGSLCTIRYFLSLYLYLFSYCTHISSRYAIQSRAGAPPRDWLSLGRPTNLSLARLLHFPRSHSPTNTMLAREPQSDPSRPIGSPRAGSTYKRGRQVFLGGGRGRKSQEEKERKKSRSGVVEVKVYGSLKSFSGSFESRIKSKKVVRGSFLVKIFEAERYVMSATFIRKIERLSDDDAKDV